MSWKWGLWDLQQNQLIHGGYQQTHENHESHLFSSHPQERWKYAVQKHRPPLRSHSACPPTNVLSWRISEVWIWSIDATSIIGIFLQSSTINAIKNKSLLNKYTRESFQTIDKRAPDICMGRTHSRKFPRVRISADICLSNQTWTAKDQQQTIKHRVSGQIGIHGIELLLVRNAETDKRCKDKKCKC